MAFCGAGGPLWRRSRGPAAVLATAALAALTACSGHSSSGVKAGTPSPTGSASHGTVVQRDDSSRGSALPGMPPVLDRNDIYAAAGAGRLAPFMRRVRPLVYVPETLSNEVTVIDPKTYRVLYHIPVGRLPQHVVPSYDMRTLWVNDNVGNDLVPINPLTGKAGPPVPVNDPYNLYFTPDGRYAVVMAERDHEIDFRDPHTMRLHDRLLLPGCDGVNHADFSANGRYFVASCEFNGRLIKVDTRTHQLVKTLVLPRAGAQPQDVKLSPDGRIFYVADMISDGVWLVDGVDMRLLGFIPTGKGAHGLYVSRDAKYLYVTNRDEGSISLVDFATRKVVKKWWIPGGGSPDMGNLSADGKVLWLSGRYNAEVYAIDTTNGKLLARIKVGIGPHGLTIYPQPGRYSLGHTGIFR